MPGGDGIPLIPMLRRERKVNLCDTEVSLDFKESSRIAREVTQRNLVWNLLAS